MNRNVESHFALNPTSIEMPRSTFDRSSSVKTSFNVGEVIPFYVDEVLPGDTFKVKSSKVVRLQTMLTPMMDNVYLDTYYFFVPNRLTWTHWKQFNGENTESAWIPQTEYEIPQLTSPDDTGFAVGTIADYFGIPTGIANLSVNALPFRAYALIMNEWFRDQNLQDPLLIPVDDATVEGVNTGTYVTDVAKGGKPFIAAKYHDYFTSALPSPQKGPDVSIPVAEAGQFAVVPRAEHVPSGLLTENAVYGNGVGGAYYKISNNGYDTPYMFNQPNSSERIYMNGNSSSTITDGPLTPLNLWAVSTGAAQAASINQLRLAFQIQKLYERDARGGK